MCVTSDLEGKHCGYGRVGVENGAAEAGFSLLLLCLPFFPAQKCG